MKQDKPSKARDVALPWSDGSLSARLWQSGSRTVVGVPELGLHCYGSSEPEAVFRLFTCLVKYYRQLKAHQHKLGNRGLAHLRLLKQWMCAVERRMMDPAALGARHRAD